MATNIKNIRLLGGEDILGEIVTDGSTFITVKNPVRVMVVPSKADPKAPSIGFAPYCEWSDEKQFNISKALIVTTMTVIPEFINQYNAIFGGIQIPNSKIITP